MPCRCNDKCDQSYAQQAPQEILKRCMGNLELIEFAVVHLAMLNNAQKNLLNSAAKVHAVLGTSGWKQFMRLIFDVSRGPQTSDRGVECSNQLNSKIEAAC